MQHTWLTPVSFEISAAIIGININNKILKKGKKMEVSGRNQPMP